MLEQSSTTRWRYYSEAVYNGEIHIPEEKYYSSIRKTVTTSENIINSYDLFLKTTFFNDLPIRFRVPRKLKIFLFPTEQIAQEILNKKDLHLLSATFEKNLEEIVYSGINKVMTIDCNLELKRDQTIYLLVTTDEQKYALEPSLTTLEINRI